MRTASPTVTLALTLAIALMTLSQPAPGTAETNPCHNDKWSLGVDVTCEKVVMPRWMCPACRLKAPKPDGNFRDCSSIYDITSASCKKYLRLYASRNKKCDPVRWRQTRDFSNRENVQGLDYFVYSVCEQCCDCVPRGSTPSQFDFRRKTDTLMEVTRGNCAAHAWYDICTVWPKLRYVIDPKGLFRPPTWRPYVCPLLTKWIRRPANNPWIFATGLFVDPPLKRFFNHFFDVVNCRSKRVWSPCADLEKKQGRL